MCVSWGVGGLGLVEGRKEGRREGTYSGFSF